MNYLILKVLYISICLATTASGSQSRDLAGDFIERVFRFPHSEIDNERTPDQNDMLDKMPTEEDCTNTLEDLPEYTETVRSTHERELRQIGSKKHYPICHQERQIRRLDTDEYEYRPAYYEEVKCMTLSRGEEVGENNEICSSLGFSCVQWNKTIHLTRRRYNSECWESVKMVILAGCECMWPVHHLGDMKYHI